MFRTLAATLAALALVPAVAAADPDAKAILAAHLANLDSFTRFTVRYDATAGTASTPADALAGRLQEVETATAVWARDGATEALKVLTGTTAAAPPMSPKKNELIPLPGFPGLGLGRGQAYRTTGYLGGRTRSVVQVPEFRVATLDGTGRPLNLSGRVWDIGVLPENPDPPRAAASRGTPAVATADTLDGAPMIKVKFQFNEMAVECLFDPARACLLRRQTLTQLTGPVPGYQDVTEWLDPREAKPGRWLPGRVHSRYKQPSMPHWIVREMRVTTLTVDERPARTDMTLNLSAKHRVQDRADSFRFMNLRNDEAVHADDLDRLWDTLERVVAEKPAGEGERRAAAGHPN